LRSMWDAVIGRRVLQRWPRSTCEQRLLGLFGKETVIMMATEGAGARDRTTVDWRRAEFVLTLLGFLGFVTALIKIGTVYDGLPAHPLIIHVPVVLIPLSIVGALACVTRPQWFDRYGVLLCLVSIVGMSSIFLAMNAGSALQGILHLTGEPARLISEHSQAAGILAVIFVAFTATLILTFSAERINGPMGATGLVFADRILGARRTQITLRVILVALALASAYMVFRVGDLGAKAVWLQKVQAAERASHG
jgi:hypothetical protein